MNLFKLKNGQEVVFSKTEMMGIINVTVDSFFSGSRVEQNDVVKKASQFIEEGALILDIGAESTRPGSDPVEEEVEIKRIVNAVCAIKTVHPDVLLSIDTYRANTAEAAIQAGADIINDISGLTFDPKMVHVVAKYKVPIIIMHIKGTPKDMQKNPYYDDVCKEVREFFETQIQYALDYGVSKDRIILDPGIGFGKNSDHNLELIRKIDFMKDFQLPILLAVSRKTFIGKVAGGLPPEDRLDGTIAISCFAAMKRLEMVRVHDVKENLRAVRMMELLI